MTEHEALELGRGSASGDGCAIYEAIDFTP
jgi:hypothetical protein